MSSAKGLPLFKFAIRYEQDIVTVRQKTRDLSLLLGFEQQDQARLATSISELARNVFQYAKTGTVDFIFSLQTPQTLFIKVVDQGPGIKDLDAILDGAYVSPTGMGVGLLGSKKLSDTFDIDTSDKGTMIIIGKRLDKRAKPQTVESLNKVIEKLMVRQPGSAFEEIQNQNRELLKALDDVSAAREELKALNNELAETNRGVVALYAELDEKAESLRRSNEIKTSFLSNMTHEFRTPISSVISLTRLLLSRIDGELTEEQERQVGYIQKSSQGLLELVNDLLDIAKVEAGKVSVDAKEFDIEELLGSLRGMFRPIIGTTSEVKFDVEYVGEKFNMITDQAKLAQILRNLVSNAVKFTEKGSITVSAELFNKDFVQFKVTDTGLGIDPENLDLIFEDFSQIESTLQKKQKGTGLGLPLSKKLAGLLEGQITVASVIGKGSVFTVTLPRFYSGENEAVLITLTPGKPEESSMEQTFATNSAFKVLLVDDDEASRYVLRSLVSNEIDARFVEATNGKEGFDLFKVHKPDLLFLDLAMPIMGGLELLKKLKDEALLDDTPVIINTATDLSPSETVYLKSLVTAVLSKDRTNNDEAIAALRAALMAAGFDYQRK